MIIIKYKYNDTHYKMLNYGNIIQFPIYLKNQIMKYPFINEIKDAYILRNNNHINVLNDIIKYIGPNYNFYNDINYITVKDIVKEYLSDDILCLTDSFEILYQFKMNDNLIWNPKIY